MSNFGPVGIVPSVEDIQAIRNRYKGSPQGVSGYSHAVSPALRYAIQLFKLKSIPPELPREVRDS
jgi:hypothetical protein